jgi:iron complex transport system substrate-binding protein
LAVTLRDDRGRAVAIRSAPRRVVSLLPSLTESVCVLGACDRLVGTDRFSNHPESVRALPKLGGLDDAQIERIVALRPDLVLLATSSRADARLEALGVPVASFRSDTMDDVARTLRTLATWLGDPAAAERALAGIEADLARARSRVPSGLLGARTYVEVDTTPYAAGEASFLGATLTRLGLANAVPAALGAFPKLNPEFVVRAAPTLVVASAGNVAHMRGRPGWAGIPALAEGRVCALPAERFELLVRPGPRVGEAALRLVDCLHGLPPIGAVAR